MMEAHDNVFVLGLDERNLSLLQELPQLRDYRLHQLLSKEELLLGEVELAEHLEQARERLEAFDGPIDAITGFWDFPVSSMTPILCREYGLTSPSLESVVKCEHKFWSRLEQREVTDAHPRFELVHLDGRPPLPNLRYPFWLKPVKSYSSLLAYEIANETEFYRAVENIRQGIGRIGAAFDYLLEQVSLDPEVADAGGMACLAEEKIQGRQLTTEGYVFGGQPHVYGVIDSVNCSDVPSFLRYQYPSSVPEDIRDRVCDISRRVIQRIGLDASTFNVEFFWDPDRDVVNIVEVNPRLSQSHAPLFELVDGMPNHHVMIRLAAGKSPELPRGEGHVNMAAKWFLRAFQDGVVRRCPSEEDLQRLHTELPESIVEISAQQGDRLSELPTQDGYSYELATVYLGGQDEAELLDRYHRCQTLLPFEILEDS